MQAIINFFPNLIDLIVGILRSYFVDIFELAREIRLERKCLSLLLKRTIDLTFSFAGLIFFLPIILAAGAVVKLNSKGPMFYAQDRVGKNGRLFTIYKIRSMAQDAESKTGPVWAKRDDPRIVNGCHFMRQYHIDELPQLFNVLKGEMSLVGPRPERPEIMERFKHLIPNYDERLRIKPGITGYAQIRHKYDESFKDVSRKLRYELFYIKKVCLIVDLSILLGTAQQILMQRDEYGPKRKAVYA